MFRTPETSWTAIVQGAVVCGIEKGNINNLKKSTYCRHSYAICLDELYSEHIHSESDMVEGKHTKFAESQLKWLLNEGDIVIADQPRIVERVFDIEFPKSKTDVIPFHIYGHSQTDDEERPTRFKNARDGTYNRWTL
jgi:hypothetical protein